MQKQNLRAKVCQHCTNYLQGGGDLRAGYHTNSTYCTILHQKGIITERLGSMENVGIHKGREFVKKAFTIQKRRMGKWNIESIK